MAPDGSVFASGSEDGTLRFWDGSTGNEVGEPIDTHSRGDQGVWGLAFSPDRQRVAATGNHTVQIWDVRSRALVTGPLHIPGGGEYTVSFSHDASRIAVDAGDGSVRVLDSVSGEIVFDSLKGHTDYVRWTAFTPNGRRLVTVSYDATICLWDMQSGARIGKQLTGHSSWIIDGVLSRDGNTLATASRDRTVRFWDLKMGTQKSRFLQHESQIGRVALSRDGSLLATAGSDGKVHIWDMKAIEAEFGDQVQDNVEPSNEQIQPDVAEEQGKAEPVQERDQLKATSQDDSRSETSSTRRRLDILAVGFPLSGAGPEASYYDREGGFWEGYNRAGPSDAREPGKEQADDPNEDKLDSHSQHRIFKRLKLIRQSLESSKKSKDDPANVLIPPPDSEGPGAVENPGRTSPHASRMALDPFADVELAQIHRALEDSLRANTLHPPSTAHPSAVGSHHPMSKVAGPRASWKSPWNPARRQHPDITTIYSCKAEDRHVAAADPSQPSQVPEQWETVLGDYITHSVLPDIPAHTPTDDNHHDGPNETPSVPSPGVCCGLCSRLFSRRPTPRPNDPDARGSGVEMAELRKQVGDGATSATAQPITLPGPSDHDVARTKVTTASLSTNVQSTLSSHWAHNLSVPLSNHPESPPANVTTSRMDTTEVLVHPSTISSQTLSPPAQAPACADLNIYMGDARSEAESNPWLPTDTERVDRASAPASTEYMGQLHPDNPWCDD